MPLTCCFEAGEFLDGDVVVYRIDDTVYRYLDRTRQANGFVTINERTGEVSLGQAPKEFAGGVF
uniref:Uncharacterized protein n=1 Tax=Parascaris equorum TaxID=6256 RepID=A0A914RP83_PAREQ